MDLNHFLPVPTRDEIVVVTGWRNVGKTNYCKQAVSVYRTAGLSVAGLLSLGRFDGKQKTGFFAFDIASGESRLVASSIPGEISGIQLGTWTFDTQVFAWENCCLQQVDGADVLVLDELGPLEFERQIGWMISFELLRKKNYRLALVVIRPEFLEFFSRMGFVFQTKEISLSKE